MSYKKLSFACFCIAVLGVFLLVKAFKGHDGQAIAAPSISGVAYKTHYSQSDKRALRRQVMYKAGGLSYLNGRDVQAILKTPELVRQDLPTVIWQYRNEMCVLDVYFTTNEPKAFKAPVVHYEVRARNSALRDEDVQDACINDLVRERAGQSLFNLQALYKAN